MKLITLSSPNTATISLEGYNFNFTENVFLSCNNANYTLTAFNYFSNSPFLSSVFPVISGFEYFNYKIINGNSLRVYVDSLSLPVSGNYDIIIKNKAGYYLMSQTGYLIVF